MRKALTFLLGKGRHNRKEYFAFGVHCVDGFLLEENRNVKVFELSDVFQAVQRVTGKAADRFGDNHINVSGMAFFNHAVKLVTLFCVSHDAERSQAGFVTLSS